MCSNDNCSNGARAKMKSVGLHCATLAQLERRGGMVGSPILRVGDIARYIQSLRDASNGDKRVEMNDSARSQFGGGGIWDFDHW